MPNEQILALALSGAEIKKAILDHIERALRRNCHLNDSLAYGDGFWFKVHIELKANDLGRKVEGEVEEEGAYALDPSTGKLMPTDPEEYAALEASEATLEVEMTDPTSMRIDTGQAVPVRVTDKQGRDSIREVKFRRDAKK
jgi:hypothetical protein